MNLIRSPKVKIEDLLFFAALGIYLSDQIFEYTVCGYIARDTGSQIIPVLKALRYACYLFCCFKILITTYRQNQLLSILVTMCVCALVALNAEKQILLWFLFIWASKGVDRKLLIKFVMMLQLFWLLLVMSLSLLGIIENYSRFTGGRTRYFLGFGWTTTAPILFLFIVWQYLYLKKGNIKLCRSVIILLFATVLYLYTRTRMAYFMLVCSIVIFQIFRLPVAKSIYKNFWKWHGSRLIVIMPWVCAIVSCVLVFFYSKGFPIMEQIDALLSNRLEMGYEGFKNFGITLFGQDIEWVGFSILELQGKYNFVDNSYLNILYNYGAVLLLVILIAYSVILYKAYVKKNMSLVIVVTFICVFSITEPRLLNLMYNPFIFFAIPGSEKMRGKYRTLSMNRTYERIQK